MLSRFQWWRRFRGGKWACVTGLICGRRWIRLPDDYEYMRDVTEFW
jgi:hypothetical protein